MRCRMLLVTALVGTVTLALPALGAEAAAAFEKGEALLAQGNFEGAFDAFKAASQADPDEAKYFRYAALLRRVINIREQLATETDDEMWQRMSGALYTFYRIHHVDREAVTLATEMHKRAGSGETAVMLADAQLEVGENEAALKTLAALPQAQQTPHTTVLHAVALARTDGDDAAAVIARDFEMPKDCDGALCFDAARMYALVGSDDVALKTLVCAFEGTPANLLDDVKGRAKTCVDLAGLRAAPAFATALETASKVKGGCGGCANKGSCSSASKGCDSKSTCSDKDKAKDASGCKDEKH
jgi:thioredoxin-like negative regulator of GroEL